MSDNLAALLAELIRLDTRFKKALSRRNVAGAGQVLLQAVGLDHRLRYRTTKATVVQGRCEEWKRYRRRDFEILRSVDKCQISGWELVDVNDPSRLALADEHLASVLDLSDPDWSAALDERLIEAAFVVTASELPPWVIRHFKTARRCYALGMYDATLIFLRGLVEAVSFDWVLRKGLVPVGDRLRTLAEWRLQETLHHVRNQRGVVPSSLMKRIDALVREANDVIHSKRSIDLPTRGRALQAITDVVDYSECLSA